MTHTCSLKPNSETCLAQMKKGVITTGCGGCPVSSGKTHVCCSTHSGATDTKKGHATANAVSEKQKNKKDLEVEASKNPQAYSDGTGHLSNTKYHARDVTPSNMSRIKTIGQ